MENESKRTENDLKRPRVEEDSDTESEEDNPLSQPYTLAEVTNLKNEAREIGPIEFCAKYSDVHPLKLLFAFHFPIVRL